jgi:hypothetical protein
MGNYLVRVELHSATWDDYESLHAEMADRGFSREITGADGVSYQLPTAEYVIYSESALERVRALAAEAAKTTGRKFGVIVAEYSRSAWAGLAYA